MSDAEYYQAHKDDPREWGQPIQMPLPTITRRCQHIAASGPLLKMTCDRCGEMPVVARSA
jgi:hypothetical protein